MNIFGIFFSFIRKVDIWGRRKFFITATVGPSIIKEFICAERFSNWMLHLQAVTKMANLFVATGHVNYARRTYMYVQDMLDLPNSHPWLHQKFMEGHHAIRRSDRFWAGLWSDLVIEQTLMCSLKSKGGLTRGRGFTENVRNLWVWSISHSAAVHEAMTSLSGIKMTSSEQHVEMTTKRMLIDTNDHMVFHRWIEARNPFNMEDITFIHYLVDWSRSNAKIT